MFTTACSHVRLRSLRRLSLVALGLVTVAALVWLGIAAAARTVDDAAGTPLYTVASLRTHLQQGPAAWPQRTVRVHAVAVRCLAWLAGPGSACIDQQPELVDAHDAAMAGLPLVAAPAPPALAWLRGLPLLGRFAPPPRALHWGIPTDYALRIRAIPCAAGSPPPCYQALLQDAVL